MIRPNIAYCISLVCIEFIFSLERLSQIKKTEDNASGTPVLRAQRGILCKESMVLYPLKNPTDTGVIRWYPLKDDVGLLPRFLKELVMIKEKLRLARVTTPLRLLND